MAKIFVFFWCCAGLLTLDVVLRASPRPRSAVTATPADSLPVIQMIRTRCELPAGTVVFVVGEREQSP